MQYDVVIGGGGSAGCTLATRLSEDPTPERHHQPADGRYLQDGAEHRHHGGGGPILPGARHRGAARRGPVDMPQCRAGEHPCDGNHDGRASHRLDHLTRRVVMAPAQPHILSEGIAESTYVGTLQRRGAPLIANLSNHLQLNRGISFLA